MVHAGLAAATRIDQLNITADEAAKLAKAAQNVLRHYDAPVILQETKDWIGLIVTCGSVYGPRIAAAFVSKAVATAEPHHDAKVVPINGIAGLTAPTG